MLRARPALRLACRIAWLAACAAACVPRGDPPAGRQIVADRTTTLVGMALPNGDGTTRVLITRPGQDGSADLYVVSLDAAGTAPAERLLAASLPGDFYARCGIGPRDCLGSDPRGRLFLPTRRDPNMDLVLTRLDPVTGDRLELGAGVAFYLFSASGDRLLAGQAFDNEATLYEPDGRTIALGETRGVSFVGEDLYYLTAQQELLRIVPGGAPERLATGLTSFSNFLTTGGDLLIVLARQQPPDPFSFRQSLLDPVTLEETPSPFGSGQFTISPDGQWLLLVDFGGGRATFVDRTTGAQDVFDLPVTQNGNAFAGFEWRPGHNEVWFRDNGFSDPVIWSKKPGAPAVEIHARAYTLGYGFGQGSSYFTRDGAYWFSSRTKLSETPIIQAGPADDPAGARFDLAPAGAQSEGYLQLADGRILTEAWISEPTRADLYALAPATGDSRALGQAGFLIAAGQTRLLANQYVNDGRGDLTAVELATGRTTVLAPEVAMSAVVERRGADPVAPGAPVAFQFRARFASPFDGIWVATIP